MSFNKYSSARLVEPLISINDWEKMHKTASPKYLFDSVNKFHKTASDYTKYILSHCTIMASVQTEEGHEDWKIKPACSVFCNNNDDAWENQVLKLSAPTFVGAFNFVEHFQNSRWSKGHIISEVLRKVHLTEDCWIYYVDILVATDLKHEKLASDIKSGKVKYLSMGCVTDLVICSFCGQHVTDASTYCHHLQFNKGSFLPDDDGIPRRVAELCGHKSIPGGGVKFVEASWVQTPAFPGAVKRSIVAEEWLGPATRWTSHINGADKAAFSKAAMENSNYSSSNLGDLLLNKDDGRNLR